MLMADRGPVTVVISRHVREGREEDFKAVLGRWIPRLVAFPGHEGVLMLHPLPPEREFGAILRFRSRDDWESFRGWSEYGLFLQELQPLLERQPRVQHLTGLEALFPVPVDGAAPPRWRLAIVTWIGVCFTVGTLGVTLGPCLSDWSWLSKLLIMNAAVVVALTWCVMPILSRLLSAWLLPSKGIAS